MKYTEEDMELLRIGIEDQNTKMKDIQAQNAVMREALEKVRRTLALILEPRDSTMTRTLVYSGEDICDKALSLTPSDAAEMVKPDYAYNVDNWDATYPWPETMYELLDNLPCLEILEIGFLKSLSSRFYVKFYDEENDCYEDKSFNTKSEALAAIEAARAAGVEVDHD